MQTKILKAKPVIDAQIETLQESVKNCGKVGLAVVMVGDNPASAKYVNNKKKMCERVGINIQIFHFEKATPIQVYTTIQELNEDPDIHGIILQLPLPDNLKPYEQMLINSIIPEKDVDGLTDDSQVGLFLNGKEATFIPCTPAGIVDLMLGYNIPIQDSNITIVGRGQLIGKPLAELLKSLNANITILHSKTSKEKMTQAFTFADVIITCCGKGRMFNRELWDYLTVDRTSEVIVIDCSTVEIEDENGNHVMVGDCYTEELLDHWSVSAITSVFGCVGPMTVLSLIKNTIRAAEIYG